MLRDRIELLIANTEGIRNNGCHGIAVRKMNGKRVRKDFDPDFVYPSRRSRGDMTVKRLTEKIREYLPHGYQVTIYKPNGSVSPGHLLVKNLRTLWESSAG
jgi:hypothetical protein